MASLHASARRTLAMARVARAVRAVRRAPEGLEKQRAQRALADMLGEARGLLMKAGQLFAKNQEDDPFADLVLGVEPLALDAIQAQIESELHAPLQRIFKEFSPTGVAASLGQVHRARLSSSGRFVAVKVQYPAIADAVAAELSLAGLVPGVGKVKSWGFDLEGYKHELSANMERELDYLNEAERQLHFRSQVQVPGLIVPNVLLEYSTRRVLVSDWVDGHSILEARALPHSERLRLGRILLETLFHSVFVARLVHGDPHSGNFYFTRERGTLELGLLDFGCTLELAEGAAQALLRLIVLRREGLPCNTLEEFVSMGFDRARLELLGTKLEAFADLLFEPFQGEGAFDLRSYRLGQRSAALLGELKWHFRAAGPPRLFLLLRAFGGVLAQLEALDVRLSFHAVLCRAVGPERLQAVLNSNPSRGTLSRSTSSVLTVRVLKQGRSPILLGFPGSSALELRKLIPDEVQDTLARDGIDLRAIELDVRERGLAPRTLLKHAAHGTQYEVALQPSPARST